MRTETAADPTPADREITKRARRALPITKRTARSGKVSYTFQIDAGTKPDGSRDRPGHQTTGLRPWMIRTRTTMIAMTSSTWMRFPTWNAKNPSSHPMIRIAMMISSTRHPHTGNMQLLKRLSFESTPDRSGARATPALSSTRPSALRMHAART